MATNFVASVAAGWASTGLCSASSYPRDAMQARVLAMTLCRVYVSSVAEYYSYHRALL